ncbi:DUF1624 domain-containing protein [bacterium]|nr:DUF1624 domain-containing protein [bacterium]
MIQQRHRLQSLDLFRGIAVLGMLLADFPGSWDSIFSPFQHAHWNGWTQTDLIFPSFLFIVGISITLSYNKHLTQGTPIKKLLLKALKRSAILFVLGMITNIFYSYPAFEWPTFRIMGVLQRIAIVYFVATTIALYFNFKKIVLTSFTILLTYWGAMTLITVPGYGSPDLAIYPEGITSNLAAWIDMKVLGTHVFAWTKPWDPEGLLTTLPALVNVLAGILAGRWILQKRNESEKTTWMFIVAIGLILLGCVWHFTFPVNKKIWSSSYVLLSSGIGLSFFSALYWLLDVKKIKFPIHPFNILGMNAIGIFTACYLFDGAMYHIPISKGGTEIVLRDFLYSTFYASWLQPMWASFLYTIIFIVIWIFIFHLLDKKGWKFKI